jgi:hypothetical protein
MNVKEIDWKIVDTALHSAANLGQVVWSLNQQGYDICKRTLQKKIEEKYNMTFTEYREYQLSGTTIKLIQTALGMAFAKDRVMLIFCLKNLAGWTDKQEQITIDKSETIETFLKRIKEQTDKQ